MQEEKTIFSYFYVNATKVIILPIFLIFKNIYIYFILPFLADFIHKILIGILSRSIELILSIDSILHPIPKVLKL